MISFRKIAAMALGAVSVGVGLVLFVVQANLVSTRMLRAGQLEGQGFSQAVRAFFGGPLLLLLATAWLALVIFCFDYYRTGVEKGELLTRFAMISALELYCFPLTVIFYHVAYPISMMFTDWILASGGLFLGCIALYVHYAGKEEAHA